MDREEKVATEESSQMKVKKEAIEDLALIADIARQYHVLGMKQQEIADKLKMSQTEVSRNLSKAEELGIVRKTVEIDPKFTRDIEEDIKQRFPHLKEAIVVPVIEVAARGRSDPLLEALGSACAEYFSRVVRTRDKVGIGCGVSVEAFVKAYSQLCSQLEYLPDECEIYQLAVMKMKDIFSVSPAALVSNLMRCLPNPVGYAFQFPEILENEPDPFELKAIQKWHKDEEKNEDIGNLDHYFIGIGLMDYAGGIKKAPIRNRMSTYDFSELMWKEYSIVKRLQDIGAIGETLYQTYDLNGEVLEDKNVVDFFKNYCWCLSLKRLQKIVRDKKSERKDVNVVAIAGGSGKHQAILGALRTKIFNVLITDSGSAKYILK
jgi:DNA-binding transcriptional regulator LsrR (DeoR family)